MNTDGLTPITALLFFGAVLAGGVVAAVYVFARIKQREQLARGSLVAMLAGAGAYVVLLLATGLFSESRVLAVGEEKHICELDCHLAYSVAGAISEPIDSGRVRHTVTVRVRFDAETTAPWRPQGRPLSPNSRYVALIDGQGSRYRGSVDGLRRQLVPGESYTTDVVFDVPADADELRLILGSNDRPTPFIIGHENSLFHAKTTFALPGRT